MEHIVQFGVGIDDEAIKSRIYEVAEKQILETLTHDVKSALFEKDYRGRKNKEFTDIPTAYLDSRITIYLESCRDDIIELAAEKLADRLCRTKKAKERLDIILNACDPE